MATNVVMPQLGESVVEGTVGKWFKQVGEKIDQYEPIMEVVTDKVTTEIPSPAAGTLLQVLVPEGTTVQAGTVLAVIGETGEKVEKPSSAAPQGPSKETLAGPQTAEKTATTAPAEPRREVAAAVSHVPPPQQAPEKKDGGAALRLTPVVARMISEFNISQEELKGIQGTGDGGRVSKKDVENYLKTRGQEKPAPAPELAPWEMPGTGELFRPTEEIFEKPATPKPTGKAKPQEVETKPAGAAVPSPKPAPAAAEELIPLSQMRRAIAEHMVRSKQVAPHVTTIHDVDMSHVIAHLKAHQDEFAKQGVKLTYTPYFVQAAVAALKAVPIVNAQFTDKGIAIKHDINIGVAVAMEEGLIVPVIKHADEKSLLGLARAINDLSARSREKRLSPDDVQGGTFTITNYGIFGSLFGTPVINQPQSAIMGIGAIQKRVIVVDEAIAIRPMVYLGLTFDHRLLDGAIGDQFMNAAKKFLETYQGM